MSGTFIRSLYIKWVLSCLLLRNLEHRPSEPVTSVLLFFSPCLLEGSEFQCPLWCLHLKKKNTLHLTLCPLYECLASQKRILLLICFFWGGEIESVLLPRFICLNRGVCVWVCWTLERERRERNSCYLGSSVYTEVCVGMLNSCYLGFFF